MRTQEMFTKHFARITTGRTQNFKQFSRLKRVKTWVEDCESSGHHIKNHTTGNVETAKSSSKAIEVQFLRQLSCQGLSGGIYQGIQREDVNMTWICALVCTGCLPMGRNGLRFVPKTAEKRKIGAKLRLKSYNRRRSLDLLLLPQKPDTDRNL